MLKAIANVAASSTDSQLVAATSGKKIRVMGLIIKSAGTATTVTFNSKIPSQAPVAISPSLAMGVNDDLVLSPLECGWFNDTASGAALTVTTGAGATTGIMVLYELIDA